MLSTVRAIACRALIVALSTTLAGGTLAAGAATSLDELNELNVRAWSGEPELLSQTYAPDGVHTATFYDRTNEYVGPEEIAMVAGYGGGPQVVGPRIDIALIKDRSRSGQLRLACSGSACLWHAVEDGSSATTASTREQLRQSASKTRS